MNTKNIISWILRLTVAIILIQTLYFKFSAHPDSVYIFSNLGVEPWGRILLGIIELITAILIIIPKSKIIGMVTSLGIIIGAIFSHILVLGINVSNDGGGLFTLAIIVLISSVVFLIMHQQELTALAHKVK
jgi:putative oxidoreductase